MRAPAARPRTGCIAAAGPSLVALDAGEAGRLHHQQDQHQQEAYGDRVLRPEELASEAFDDAEPRAPNQRPLHAAEPADDADDEGLAEIDAGKIGGDRIDHGEDHAGDARHQRSDAAGYGRNAVALEA